MPRRLEHIELVIICQTNLQGNNYDCYVSKCNVLNALNYKIKNDQYYKDVVIDVDALDLLPEITIDVSNMLHNLGTTIEDITTTIKLDDRLNDDIYSHNTSSFIPKLPMRTRYMQSGTCTYAQKV